MAINGPKVKSVFLGIAAIALIGFIFKPKPPVQNYPNREKVRFWHMWSGEWKDVINKIVLRFNQSQDKYELVALSIPSGASTKFLMGVAGGNPPDVMAQWEQVIPTWAESGLIQDLRPLMTPEEYAMFDREAYPLVKKIGMYKGKLYGVTTGINISGIYYRPDFFRAAGIDPDHFPKTLEEIDSIAPKLDVWDKDKQLKRIGWLSPNWTSLAPAFGGGFYDWKAGKLTLDRLENIRALEYMVNSRKRLGFDRVVRFQSGYGSDFGAAWSFIGGAQAIQMDGMWRIEQIGKYAPTLPYRVMAMPPPKGGVPLSGSTGGNFMIIPTGAKNPKGAAAFLKFWSGIDNPEGAAEFYTWGGWLPLYPRVTNSKIYQAYLTKYPQYKPMLAMMGSEHVDPSPPVIIQQFLMDKINQKQDLALRGVVKPAQAVKDLTREVNEELARRRKLGYAE